MLTFTAQQDVRERRKTDDHLLREVDNRRNRVAAGSEDQLFQPLAILSSGQSQPKRFRGAIPRAERRRAGFSVDGSKSLQNMFRVEAEIPAANLVPFRPRGPRADSEGRQRAVQLIAGRGENSGSGGRSVRFQRLRRMVRELPNTSGRGANETSRAEARSVLALVSGVNAPVAVAALFVAVAVAGVSWEMRMHVLYPTATAIALPATDNMDALMLDASGAAPLATSGPVLDAEAVIPGGSPTSYPASGSAVVASDPGASGSAAVVSPNIDVSQYQALKVSRYTVKKGDSLSGIAHRFGLAEDTLVSFNQISDVRRIQVGAVFSIPNRDGLLYTVQRGDSLSSIAGSYGVSVNSILDANNLTSSTIRTNQDLFIPGARMDPFQLKLALGQAFQLPVTSYVLTSPFGFRPDPFTGVRTFHNGIDMAGYYGQPIHAAGNGTVLDVGFNSIYGNYVVIGHSGGFQTLYGHMSRQLVAKGQRVSAGDRIGLMGSTGYSTGTHLHFSIYRNNQPVNPLQYLP